MMDFSSIAFVLAAIAESQVFFYTLDGMSVGSYRKVSISPHLACGESGIPGLIPPQAKLIVEIKVLTYICHTPTKND